MSSTINPYGGEFGRHWQDHTGAYLWDGHANGVDMNLWAYAHNAVQEPAGFTVLVQQMLPAPIHLHDADPVSWCVRFLTGPGGELLEHAFTASEGAMISLVHSVAERIPFEWLPEDLGRQVWKFAAEGFLDREGRDLVYDGEGGWRSV